MIIDCIGCIHGYYPKLEGGDLLIITGDLTKRDDLKEYNELNHWISRQKYHKVIIIAGNHDNLLKDYIHSNLHCFQEEILVPAIWMSSTYLQDRAYEYNGLKFWGSPHSLWFERINPLCAAFTGDETYLKKHYQHIPDDIDVIISHTPFYGVLDKNDSGHHCGSIELKNVVDRIKPKYFICSHIHEEGGHRVQYKDTQCINCSMVDVNYKLRPHIMRIEH